MASNRIVLFLKAGLCKVLFFGKLMQTRNHANSLLTKSKLLVFHCFVFVYPSHDVPIRFICKTDCDFIRRKLSAILRSILNLLGYITTDICTYVL